MIKLLLPVQLSPETEIKISLQLNEEAQKKVNRYREVFRNSPKMLEMYVDKLISASNPEELKEANEPMSGGPFKPVLAALQQIQKAFPSGEAPLRTCLVTARSAPAHERVVRTLRAWNIRIDESLFLGGLDKGEFLRAFDADVFFDDHFSIE